METLYNDTPMNMHNKVDDYLLKNTNKITNICDIDMANDSTNETPNDNQPIYSSMNVKTVGPHLAFNEEHAIQMANREEHVPENQSSVNLNKYITLSHPTDMQIDHSIIGISIDNSSSQRRTYVEA